MGLLHDFFFDDTKEGAKHVARGIWDDFLTHTGQKGHVGRGGARSDNGPSIVRDASSSLFGELDGRGKSHRPPSHEREAQAVKDFFKL